MIDFSDINTIITLAVAVLLLGSLCIFIYRIIKRASILYFQIFFSLSLIATYIFQYNFLTLVVIVIFCFFLVTTVFLTMKDFRDYFANKLGFYSNKRDIKGEILFDRESVIPAVCKAVIALSKKKVGALITFERKDNLDEYVKSGSVLKAPVSEELLETIFFPGTRLHDGAVVIRIDKIYAASVYFTPTTRALTGKYGSRHRAAIGVSEVTDSITVVVSEETGRIAIADGGELQSVTSDVLMDKLNEHLNGKSKNE